MRLKPGAAFDLLGLLLFAGGFVATLNALDHELGVYDEGLILVDAMLVNQGAVPYRDFYSNYPPGLFYLVGWLFRLFGESAMVARWYGLVVHVAIALAAGRLAGALGGRRFAWMPAGLVLCWLVPLGLAPYAYLNGLLWALLAAVVFITAWQARSRVAWVAVGSCLGIGAFFRHDLLTYAALIILVCGAVVWLRQRRLDSESVRAASLVLAGGAATVLITWGRVLWRAGLSQPFHDLLLDQIRYVNPGRDLPLPDLGALQPPGPPLELPFSLPVMLHQMFEGAVGLVIAGPAALFLCVWFGRPLGLDRTLACAVGVVACAVVPQMMGRTDTTHAIYGVAPAIILIWALGEGAAGRSPRMAAPLLLVVTATALILPVRHVPALRLDTGPTRPTLQNPRGAGTVGFQNRDELAQAIQSLSAPGERIYVGLTDHRRIFISEMDLYFLADRPGATRYMQFDPNMQNRADVQQEMIRELEQHRTRLAVLSAHFTHHVEPNEVQRMGADQLDQYFRANFERKQQIGEYSLMLRKEE